MAASADVAAFSAFPGVDRELVLLRGQGLTLSFDDGSAAELRQHMDAHRFAGERGVVGVPHGGPTEQLNLMWVRGSVQAAVNVVRGVQRLSHIETGSVCLVHVCSGTAEAEGLGVYLGESDSLVIEGAHAQLPVRVSDGGVALIARFERAL